MHDFRIEDHQLTCCQLVGVVHCLDANASAQRMNHHVSGRAMLGQAGAGVEGEEHHPERPFVKDRDLSVPFGALVRLGAQRPRSKGA